MRPNDQDDAQKHQKEHTLCYSYKMAVIHNIAEQKLKVGTESLYNLEVHSISAIQEGSENSNYLLLTSEGEFVLTLFAEGQKKCDIEPRTHILPFLALNGLAVPAIVQNVEGSYVSTLEGEMAVLQPKLIGEHIQQSDIQKEHIRALATHLAMQHCLPVPDDMKSIPYEYSLANMENFLSEISTHPSGDETAVEAAKASLKKMAGKTFKAPLALTHADLFPDNTLFSNGNTLTGVIDWWMACALPCLLDLAIVANAWCWDEKVKMPHADYLEALEDTYRVLSMLPYDFWREEWPLFLEYAALIFVIMRLRNPVLGKPQSVIDAKPIGPWLDRLLYWQEQNKKLA